MGHALHDLGIDSMSVDERITLFRKSGILLLPMLDCSRPVRRKERSSTGALRKMTPRPAM